MWNLSLNIHLEIRNTVSDLDQTNHNCASPQKKTFQPSRSTENRDVIWWRQKNHFSLRIQKIYTNLYWTSQAINWAGSVRSSQILYWDAWHVQSCNWRFFRILNFFLAQDRGPRIKRRAKNAFFSYFLDPLESQLIPITTSTDIKVEQYLPVSNTSVHFFVNISITLRYFPTRVYIFWIRIEFLCLRWNWNKQGGISKFKNHVDFLIWSNKSLRFYFFWIKVTLPYSSYFCLKNITRTF